MTSKKTHFRLLAISIFTFCVYLLYTIYSFPQITLRSLFLEDIELAYENEYLVNSSKCKIININPYNSEVLKYLYRRDYVSCNDHRPLLTYIDSENEVPVLKINHSVTHLYSNFYVYCCYQNVYRKYVAESPDDYIRLSAKCKRFDNETLIESDIVKVKCQNFWHRIYENTHTVILKNETVKKKIQNFNATTRPLSVLFVGIDSISRINFVRMLPKTKTLLSRNGWIDMKGYNKMGDNTFPNLMAIFTGKNESYAFKTCHPYSIAMDKCDLIWFDFRKAGYITGYAEDETTMNTFNYLKKGFNETPTDYYFRPYFIASEELSIEFVDGLRYCTGPESSGERVLNLAKSFSAKFVNDPSFGVFWMNTFSHNDITSPSMMDEKLYDFFIDLENSSVLNNTMVIFVSDHGMRFGEVRKTRTGWFEERLPFLFIWLPDWFRNLHPQIMQNLKANENRFTTPYDLFLTLEDVLIFSNRTFNYRASSACSTCKSLFKEASTNRNCNESGIEPHWCTCESYNPLDTNSIMATEASKFIIEYINNVLVERKIDSKCQRFNVDRIMSASLSQRNHLLLMVKSKPYAVFEATVSVSDNSKMEFAMQGSVSRLDTYNSRSGCVDAFKIYCVCKNFFS